MKPLYTVLLIALAACAGVHAGEIRGVVSVRHTGLFGEDGKAGLMSDVSVAAIPMEGQALPPSQPRVQRVLVQDRAFSPAYVTLRVGDTLVFENRDEAYYELFSLSRQQPFKMRLGKAGQPASDHEKSIRLEQDGTWHVFCRIHNKAYFRVDVVDTPHILEVKPGETFSFRDLPLGRWQLRIAALGSEVVWQELASITSPPPAEFVLPVMASGTGEYARSTTDMAAVERLFPATR